MSKTAQFSISDLDITQTCEAGYEFEVVDESNGKGMGLFMTVLGAHAPTVQAWTRKTLNARRQFDEMNERRGKKAVGRSVEDDMEFAIEMAAVRVIGWRGIKDDFTIENVTKLCRVNPPIREQIFKASEDLANFTKALVKT